MMWEEGLGRKGYSVLTGAPLRTLTQFEGTREVCMEEGIPELGFEGRTGETRKRKGQGSLFFQGKEMQEGKNAWNAMAR